MFIHDKTGDAWVFIEKVTRPLRHTKVIVTLPNYGSVVRFAFPASHFEDIPDD